MKRVGFMKRILMMESGSFKAVGGAAKDTYKLYARLRLRKDYDIDLYGDFSKIDKSASVISKAELLSKDYDAVWMNSIRDVLVAVGYRKKHLGNDAKFIYVDRGNVLLNFKKARLKKLLPKMVVRRHLVSKLERWLDYYVAITQDQYNYAKNFFSEKVHVQYIPIAPHEEFRILKIRRSFWGALAVSRLDERQKKLSHMIKGIAVVKEKHPELKDKELLRIVGAGQDEGRYKALAHSLELDMNVSFYGFFVGRELIKKYNDAAFLTSTSEWEGLSRSFLEAMACGLPLLINDNINTVIKDKPLTKVVKDGYNGLVYKYGDIDDFADKFYRLYSDKMLQRKLSSNTKRFIRQFSFSRVISSYEKIIDGF